MMAAERVTAGIAQRHPEEVPCSVRPLGVRQALNPLSTWA
jgi:hypothetical protein